MSTVGSADRALATVPDDWPQLLGAIAYVFHFPPSDLWEMTLAELCFWAARSEEIRAELDAAAARH